MRKLRTVIAAIIQLTVALSLIPSVSAAEEDETGVITVTTNHMIKDYIPAVGGTGGGSLFADEDSVEDTIANALENLEDADVSAFGYHLQSTSSGYTVPDELAEYYNLALAKNPLLWYVDPDVGLSVAYNEKTLLITKVYPVSYITKSTAEIRSVQEQIAAKGDEILADINDTMTNVEKLLVVHDRIEELAAYDNTYKKYTAKELLIGGTAVCQGYASAYYYLLGRLGFSVGFVHNDEHIWNVVYMNGYWYHIDTTWDDPLTERYDGDTTGGDTLVMAYHKNFLKSNAGIAATGHSGFTYVTNANDTTYDNAFWKEIYDPVVILSNNWYYIKRNSGTGAAIMQYNAVTGNTYIFHTIDSKWAKTAGGDSFWSGTYSGLGYYDGRIFFNTSDSICSIDPEGNNLTTVYEISDTSRSVYGLYVNGNILYYGKGAKTWNYPTVKTSFTVSADENYKKFYIADDYTKNGNRYMYYVNNGGNGAVLYFASWNDKRFAGVDLIKTTDSDYGIIEIDNIANYSNTELYIFDKTTHPLAYAY